MQRCSVWWTPPYSNFGGLFYCRTFTCARYWAGFKSQVWSPSRLQVWWFETLKLQPTIFFYCRDFSRLQLLKRDFRERPASSSSKDLSPILYKIHIKLEAKKPAMKYKSGKTEEIFIFLNLLGFIKCHTHTQTHVCVYTQYTHTSHFPLFPSQGLEKVPNFTKSIGMVQKGIKNTWKALLLERRERLKREGGWRGRYLWRVTINFRASHKANF